MSAKTSPSVPDDEIEALLRAIEAPAAPRKGETRAVESMVGFKAMFSAWATEFSVVGGPKPAGTASDLFRHFHQWAETQVPGGVVVPNNVWGQSLHALGVPRGRKFVAGRDTRPYLLKANAADYFAGWVRANPPPPVGQEPFAPRVRRKPAEGAP